MSARMPAKVGAPAEVPPTPGKLPSRLRNPLAQLVAVDFCCVRSSCEQNNKDSCAFEAFNAMSGTSRFPSPGPPVPLCHDGLEQIVLAPPPPALRLVEDGASFQVFSVM